MVTQRSRRDDDQTEKDEKRQTMLDIPSHGKPKVE